MKKLLLPVLYILITAAPSFSQFRYTVHLTDKNNSPYSITNPSAYLSSKAISRRAVHNISIDQRDLPVNPSYIQGIANTGVLIYNASKWLNTVSIFTGDTNALNTILALPYVSGLSAAGRHSLPGGNDQKFKRELPYKIENPYTAARVASFDYGPSLNQIQMLNGDVLHDQGYRGQNMTIAVLDAGFLFADTLVVFDSLRNENRLNGTFDFVNEEVDVYGDDPHGAEVLSLMAGNLPGQIIGTAPKANYWLLRSEDANSEYIIEEYNWAAAAEYADSAGADLINTSLGYTEFWDTTQNHTYMDMDGNTAPVTIAADIAAEKGILVECSAGNEGGNPWNYISAPADADSVLTTGAVDDLGNYAGFSSNGPSYDGRVKPTVACQGQGAYVYYPGNSTVVPGSGTSFSGPIMTGMAACLWQAFPNMSNMDIIHAIEQSATQYTNPDTLLGYGIPDFAYAKTLLTIKEMGGDYHSDQLLNVYPNPFRDEFKFNFFSNSNQSVTIELIDLLGKRAFSETHKWYAKSLNKITIQPRTLSKGIYILHIKSAEGNFNERVIKD